MRNRIAKNSKYLFWTLFAAALILVAVRSGIVRIFNVEFFPTNGDAQTYNALRRLLDGQVPYRDFANYLGVGALVTQAPLLALHNTFAGSLFVSHFVTSVLFSVMLFVVFYLISGEKYISALVSAIFPQIISDDFLYRLPFLGGIMQWNFELLSKPNNSLRMVRMFLPVGLICLALVAVRIYETKTGKQFEVFQRIKSAKACAALGAVCGICALWSNDFGFAALGAAGTLLWLLLIKVYGKNSRAIAARIGIFIASAVGGGIGAAFAVTRGDIGAFIRFTLGVAQDQVWYYGIHPELKIHSVAEILQYPDLVFVGLVYLAGVIALVWLICKNKLRLRTLLYAFLGLTVFLADAIYIYGSGENEFREAITVFLFASAVGGGIYFAKWTFTKCKIERIVALCTVGVLCFYTGYSALRVAAQVCEYKAADFSHQADYNETLEGVFASGAGGALEGMKRIVGDEKVFSTYSTALDYMRGKFQSTYSDYIIHALGDVQRAEYLHNFENGDYQYVQTSSVDAWIWERWAIRANWYFYRALYENYHPVYQESYWTLWERNVAGESGLIEPRPQAQVSIHAVSDTTIEIAVTSDEPFTGIAEVTLQYKSERVNNLYNLQTWKRSVYVEDESATMGIADRFAVYFLPPVSEKGTAIPVYVREGLGKITLSSLPVQSTKMVVMGAQLGNVYKEK